MPKMLERLTICATGSRRSTGRNALHIRTVPQKLIANSHSMSARLTSSKRPSSATPALLINTLALACSARTATPVLRAADATAASVSRSRSTSARRQPRDARRIASAAPMPLAAPVTTATPSRSGNVIDDFPLTKTSKLATPTPWRYRPIPRQRLFRHENPADSFRDQFERRGALCGAGVPAAGAARARDRHPAAAGRGSRLGGRPAAAQFSADVNIPETRGDSGGGRGAGIGKPGGSQAHEALPWKLPALVARPPAAFRPDAACCRSAPASNGRALLHRTAFRARAHGRSARRFHRPTR